MDVSRLDWTLLRSFIAVVDAGSLLGAAKRLGSYQPTVSRQVGELESQLGVPLFERTGRGLLPTAAGRAIVEPARRMAAWAAEVHEALRGIEGDLRGSVRVACSQVVGHFLLPQSLAALRTGLPTVQIDLVSSNSVANLLRRECDIAVRMLQPVQSSVVARRVAELPMGAFAAPAYLARRPAPPRLRDLGGHDLVGLDADDTLLRALAAGGLPLAREDFAFCTDDQAAAVRLIQAGAGIGFMPKAVATRVGGLVQVLPRLPMPSLPVWLAVHREIRGNPMIRAVYDHLASDLGAAIPSAPTAKRTKPARKPRA